MPTRCIYPYFTVSLKQDVRNAKKIQQLSVNYNTTHILYNKTYASNVNKCCKQIYSQTRVNGPFKYTQPPAQKSSKNIPNLILFHCICSCVKMSTCIFIQQ